MYLIVTYTTEEKIMGENRKAIKVKKSDAQ